ncbi:crossover junction endodeoxyribonuclease RuvC [Balneolales bacterium ANBcel1]|nr:crossover junction endodeoxyribonuclease RuvC [Balneolales bacterium ANBcel1]
MKTRILGVDPGSRVTGYAILDCQTNTFVSPCCDTLSLTDIADPHERLLRLYSFFSELINSYKPDYCSIETPVYGKDPAAMLKLGRAQAAIIMATLHADVPLHEYYPKAVKKAITGNGNANKDQVAYMLGKMISLPENRLTNDATDALAVAWCHHQKISDPSLTNTHEQPRSKSRNRKNSWASFVDNHPDRIRT